MSVSATASAPAHLPFAQSNSGLQGMMGSAQQTLKKHANRVAGATSLTGDGLAMTSGIIETSALAAATATAAVNPFAWALIPATVLMIGSRLPHLFASEQSAPHHDLAAHSALTPPREKSWVEKVREDAAKTLNPREHPVEAGAGLSMLAGLFFLFLGAGNMMSGNVVTSLLDMSIGALMISARAMEIFGDDAEERAAKRAKRQQQESTSLPFARSEHTKLGMDGQRQGLMQWIEDNPEKFSGIVGGISSSLMLIRGLISGQMVFALAGAVYLASCVVYANFVRREPQEEKEDPQRPTRFTDRIAQRREETETTEASRA